MYIHPNSTVIVRNHTIQSIKDGSSLRLRDLFILYKKQDEVSRANWEILGKDGFKPFSYVGIVKIHCSTVKIKKYPVSKFTFNGEKHKLSFGEKLLAEFGIPQDSDVQCITKNVYDFQMIKTKHSTLYTIGSNMVYVVNNGKLQVKKVSELKEPTQYTRGDILATFVSEEDEKYERMEERRINKLYLYRIKYEPKQWYEDEVVETFSNLQRQDFYLRKYFALTDDIGFRVDSNREFPITSQVTEKDEHYYIISGAETAFVDSVLFNISKEYHKEPDYRQMNFYTYNGKRYMEENDEYFTNRKNKTIGLY